MIPIDLRKQQALVVDQEAAMFFIIEKRNKPF